MRRNLWESEYDFVSKHAYGAGFPENQSSILCKDMPAAQLLLINATDFAAVLLILLSFDKIPPGNQSSGFCDPRGSGNPPELLVLVSEIREICQNY